MTQLGQHGWSVPPQLADDEVDERAAMADAGEAGSAECGGVVRQCGRAQAGEQSECEIERANVVGARLGGMSLREGVQRANRCRVSLHEKPFCAVETPALEIWCSNSSSKAFKAR